MTLDFDKLSPNGWRESVTAFIGIGSNLGDPAHNAHQACLAIAAIPQTKLDAVSKPYHSKPLGFEGPDFVNLVVRIKTQLNAYELLQALQSIEVQMGRPSADARQDQPKTSRVIDLDVLTYGAAQMDSPTLAVPHPRMHERDFVQVPLAQIKE